MLLTMVAADLDGPCSRVSKMTPVFTGRVHGPWTRPVNTGSVYRPQDPSRYFLRK